VTSAAPKTRPLISGETVVCPSCAPSAGAVNHPPGCMFVGFGVGWVTCSRCNGSQKLPASAVIAGPMTGEERVAYLVKLAMEAASVTVPDEFLDGFRVRIEERARQAAMVWGAEVDCAGDSK